MTHTRADTVSNLRTVDLDSAVIEYAISSVIDHELINPDDVADSECEPDCTACAIGRAVTDAIRDLPTPGDAAPGEGQPTAETVTDDRGTLWRVTWPDGSVSDYHRIPELTIRSMIQSSHLEAAELRAILVAMGRGEGVTP